MAQRGFFDADDHLKQLSEAGDPLEEMARVIDFEAFRPELNQALQYSKRRQGGRPPYDPVVMFKIMILQAQNGLSDERMEFLIRDRLSWLRFLGFELGQRTPDENTIRLFRERLVAAGAIEDLFDAFDRQLREAGYMAMGGQIVDASLVAAPRQRNSDDEKAAIKAGQSAEEIWPGKPNKAAQKDVDARWTVKTSRPRKADTPRSVSELAIPVFGYKSHVAIDRRYGFIRGFAVSNAARHDGAFLREVVSTNNTAADVWADTAYRSAENERWLAEHGRVSRLHRKKPRGQEMPRRTRRANARKSAVRAQVEHVFAHQKERMGLFVRTIGQERAEAKIGLANLAYNMQRLVFHQRRLATG